MTSSGPRGRSRSTETAAARSVPCTAAGFSSPRRVPGSRALGFRDLGCIGLGSGASLVVLRQSCLLLGKTLSLNRGADESAADVTKPRD